MILNSQEKEDEIKRNLQMENQSWNDWKFQIYWNILEWDNPGSRIEGKIPFCVSSEKFCLKDNKKNSHWVGHQKLKPLDLGGLFKRKKC